MTGNDYRFHPAVPDREALFTIYAFERFMEISYQILPRAVSPAHHIGAWPTFPGLKDLHRDFQGRRGSTCGLMVETIGSYPDVIFTPWGQIQSDCSRNTGTVEEAAEFWRLMKEVGVVVELVKKVGYTRHLSRVVALGGVRLPTAQLAQRDVYACIDNGVEAFEAAADHLITL